MRIVHVLQRVDFHEGGPPRAVIDLCTVLHQRGHQVTLLTADPRDVPDAWSVQGSDTPDVCTVPPPRLPGGLWTSGQLADAKALLAEADVVHMHGVWERMNAQLAGICRAVGTPYVITLRGMLDDWSMAQAPLKKRLYLAMAGRRFLEGAAWVHCTAAGEKDQSHRWFPKGRPRVIPNLIDLSAYEKLPTPDEAVGVYKQLCGQGPVLLFLSRLHEKKGIEHLIAAAATLRTSFPGLQVLIAGTGEPSYRASLESHAKHLGVGDCVHFLGHVGGTLKLSLYNACDVFVLPSSQENFGFVQFEALACGTPVVTSRLVDTWAEIEASGGGLAVQQNANALVEVLTPLLNDRARRASMGAAGRAWVLEHLATDHVAGQLEAMYGDAAAGA
jgi:glycosyltransferase involved in cell wall biosynthesis